MAVASSLAVTEPTAGPNRPAITAAPNRLSLNMPLLLVDPAHEGNPRQLDFYLYIVYYLANHATSQQPV